MSIYVNFSCCVNKNKLNVTIFHADMYICTQTGVAHCKQITVQIFSSRSITKPRGGSKLGWYLKSTEFQKMKLQSSWRTASLSDSYNSIDLYAQWCHFRRAPSPRGQNEVVHRQILCAARTNLCCPILSSSFYHEDGDWMTSMNKVHCHGWQIPRNSFWVRHN